MQIRMGIRELRDTLTATIRRVEAGETIEITHHQRPVAVLTPVHRDRVQRLIDTGDVSPGASFKPLRRRFPVTGAMSASEALQEDRAER
jgi:prevent-host-death family protein